MRRELRISSARCQLNWRGVIGLVAMSAGSMLGWIAIVSGLRAILR